MEETASAKALRQEHAWVFEERRDHITVSLVNGEIRTEVGENARGQILQNQK